MISSAFPDINVWLAMAYSGHAHHVRAKAWEESLGEDADLIFCRFTQLGLLRLLTTAAVMGNRVTTQQEAWKIYDAFCAAGNVRFLQEPRSLEESLRRLADLDSASPQDWGDAYLAAFAEEASVKLVTFDKALARRAKGALLLRG